MPSSRRPREIGRALRSATFGVRRLVPDSAVVNVVEKNERGWYNVRKPHWPEGVFMSVPLVPANAAMPCPRPQTRLLFEDGDPQRPFLYWPWGRMARRGGANVFSIPYFWYCGLADFARSNSSLNTDQPFDFTNPVRQPIPVGGPFARFAEANRVIIDAGQRRLGIPYDASNPSGLKVWWSFVGDSAADSLGLSDGSFDEWYSGEWGEPEEGEERYNDFATATCDSACIVGGLIYAEIYYIIRTVTENPEEEYEYSSTTVRRVLYAISTQPPSSPSSEPETIWSLRTDEIEGYERWGGDIVVTGGRAVVYCGGPSDPHFFHVDALTGEDLQEVDLSSIEDHNNALSILAPCISNRWLPIFAPREGQPQILIGGEGTALTLIDLASNSVVWTKHDPDSEWHPIGILGNSVMCAYEEREYEVITDFVYTLDDMRLKAWWDDPQLVPRPRNPELARGHSYRAGICALSLSDGSEIGRTVFPDKFPSGEVQESTSDYYTTVNFPDWETVPNSTNPDPEAPDEYAFFPRYHNPPLPPHRHGNVPSVARFFSGELPEESYQEENETGTYIEGPRIGDNSGEFQGWRTLIEPPTWPPSSLSWTESNDVIVAAETYAWATGGDPDTQPVNPDNLGPIEATMAGIEDSRSSNGDWIRAEITLTTTRGVGIWPEGMHETMDALSSETFTSISIVRSQRETSVTWPTSPPQPRVITMDFGDTPTYPFPYYSGYLPSVVYDYTYSLEFIEWFRAWEANTELEPPFAPGDVPHPWQGSYASFSTLAGHSGGHRISYNRRIVWSRAAETTPREQTKEPALTLAPTCSTGSAIVLGPRLVSGEPLRWQAYGADGELVWERTISKEATITGVGTPIALTIEGGVGIFTFYSTATPLRHLCVLDGATGEVLHDEALPSTVGSGILQPYYGDGVIWAGNYSVGVAPGEEEG